MTTDTGVKLQIKGVKEGLLVTLSEGDWASQEEILVATIRERSVFFQGAKVAIDVGVQVIRAAEMGALRDRLSDLGVVLWAILSTSSTTEKSAQMLGLATRLSVPRPERTIRSLDTTLEGDNAIVLKKTLRSGFKVISKGHVVIIGDVNPGAEIVAGGSIVVWGRLRGVVQAGAEGESDAVVCALELNPTRLSIGSLIAALPQKKGKFQPEMAQILDGLVVMTPWTFKDR